MLTVQCKFLTNLLKICLWKCIINDNINANLSF